MNHERTPSERLVDKCQILELWIGNDLSQGQTSSQAKNGVFVNFSIGNLPLARKHRKSSTEWRNLCSFWGERVQIFANHLQPVSRPSSRASILMRASA
jgi:hypothetical protein